MASLHASRDTLHEIRFTKYASRNTLHEIRISNIQQGMSNFQVHAVIPAEAGIQRAVERKPETVTRPIVIPAEAGIQKAKYIRLPGFRIRHPGLDPGPE